MPSKSAEQSGLTMPPGRVGTILSARHYTRRKSDMVKVTIAAATEAMIAMLLDETAEQCERSGVRTMQRDHIRDAVISSDGLSMFFKDGCFIGITPTPYLSPAIIPSTRRRKRATKSAQEPAED